MLFRGATSSRQIAKKLNSDGFREALKRRGADHLDVEKIAKTFAGKDRAGLSSREMKHVVAAMQDSRLAPKARSASQLVLTASRETQDHPPVFKTPIEREQFMQRLARERRREANEEEDAAAEHDRGSLGVLERMRRQARGQTLPENERPTPNSTDSAQGFQA